MANMTKPVDLSKFRKEITKSIKGLSTGFNDPKTWISTGSLMLNYLISGDFYKGVPLEGKFTMFAGESGCLPATAQVKIKIGRKSTETVTVGIFKELFAEHGDKVKISTPDGLQSVTAWHDKGELPCVRVKTKNHETVCSGNHLIQLDIGQWMRADELSVDDAVLTESGIELVELVEPVGLLECFDFTVKHENHRYWGDGFSSHNSGKSYICSGNLVRNAQEKGVMVVIFDSENALDEQWLERLGVNTSPDKLLRVITSQIDTVGKTISDFVKTYRDEYGDLPDDDKPRVMFVIDSLGMLITPTEQDQFEKGDMKGDMGRKAKMLTSLCRNIVDKIADQPIGVIATNHVFSSQDMFNPDAKISGGQGLEFASSIIVAMEKRKLKEDEDGNKVTEVNGIRSAVTVRKSRYAKPFEKAEIKIPYTTGMSPTSGLFDFFEKKAVLKRQGNRYLYQAPDGTEFLEFKKNFTDEMLEKMAQNFMLSVKNEPSDEVEYETLVIEESSSLEETEE